jgi:hypothetical protein
MRRVYMPILLGVCLTGPGCSFVYHIKRNLITEPQYACDECVIRKRALELARRAWDAMADQYGCNFSEDYRRGFIDGFVDYLVYGGCRSGSGEAPVVPPVPPERYRHKQNMNPPGYRAMEDWFVGFRHGAATALASGLRQLIVIPVQNPPRLGYDTGTQTQPQYAGPATPAAEPPRTLPPPEGEMLPTPRTVPTPAPAAPPPPAPGGPPAPAPAGPPAPARPPAPAGPDVPPAGGPPAAKPVPPAGPMPPAPPPL